MMSVTIVTETFNLSEGQTRTALIQAIQSLSDIKGSHPNIEVMIVDPIPDPLIAEIAASIDPLLKYLAVPGLSYDAQKDAAVRHLNTDIVVFLDGDCHPVSEDWLSHLLAPFENPDIQAVGGLTIYDDLSINGKAMSILDFGYLFVDDGDVLGCYASNNVAFRRSAWLACPPSPHKSLRSNCYGHAQEMARAGLKLVLSAKAIVLHELPNVGKERLRRGYDLVAVCWANPHLEETAWVTDPDADARIFDHNVAFDEARLARAPSCLGVTEDTKATIADEIRRLRDMEREGIVVALADGAATGQNIAAEALHKTLCAPPTPSAPLLETEDHTDPVRLPGRQGSRRATVFLPVRNQQNFVEEMLRSLLAQWRDDCDLLVIDDASQDLSLATIIRVLDDYPTVSATVMRNEKPLGVGSYHNVLAYSQSEIFIQADSDDITYPGRLDAIIGCFDRDPTCRLVSSNAILLSEEGFPIALNETTRTNTIYDDPMAAARIGYIATWLGTTSACHRTVLTDFPIIDPDLCSYGFDLIAAFRALLLGTHHYLATPLVGWRQHGRNSHRVVGARATGGSDRERYKAIELMALGQKLRDVEALLEHRPESQSLPILRDACRDFFFERFACWSRLRNGIAQGSVPANVPNASIDKVAPVTTVETGVRRLFGESDPLGEIASCWSGILESERYGNWTQASALLVVRTSPKAKRLILSVHGLAMLDRMMLQVSVNHGPRATSILQGTDIMRIEVPIEQPIAHGRLIILIHAPDAATPSSFSHHHSDTRLLGVKLLELEIDET